MTITEALAETKTLVKRIEKKQEFVLDFLFRQERLKDPLEQDGGSRSAVSSARQAIRDLEDRLVDLRRGIAEANARTDLTIGGTTMSIADWLTWRREVAPRKQKFLSTVRSNLAQLRREAAQKGVAVGSEAQSLDDIVVNLNEQELAQQIEGLEETLGTLDGLLSMKNATVTINI